MKNQKIKSKKIEKVFVGVQKKKVDDWVFQGSTYQLVYKTSCYFIIWHNWYDLIPNVLRCWEQFDMTGHDKTSYDMIQNDIRVNKITWHDMTWHDMTWHMT